MVNEGLYLFIKGSSTQLPDDWRDYAYWYTILAYWLDQCGGGTDMLWYIRKVYNYLSLNTFLTNVEVINRHLQLVFILKLSGAPDHGSGIKPAHAPSLKAILDSDCKVEHICNYSWASYIFTREDDLDRAQHALSLILKSPVGVLIVPELRNSPTVLRGILEEKVKLIDNVE